MGKLILVPTPIGNLKDITFRAVEVLGSCDLILAEDTRQTRKLLDNYGIRTALQSHHAFNEHKTVASICNRIASGLTVALVSDAGSPAISDPGFLLVRNCLALGLEVESLPGPTALIPALVNSGLPSDRFCFEGFLPQKKGRNGKLAALAGEERTMIFYESPFRLARALDEMALHFGGERKASVSRELTKIHEETIRGTLAELAAHYGSNPPKGEIVIVVSGKQ